MDLGEGNAGGWRVKSRFFSRAVFQRLCVVLLENVKASCQNRKTNTTSCFCGNLPRLGRKNDTLKYEITTTRFSIFTADAQEKMKAQES